MIWAFLISFWQFSVSLKKLFFSVFYACSEKTESTQFKFFCQNKSKDNFPILGKWISCVLEYWTNNLYPKIEELLNQSFLHSIPVAPNIDSTQCTSVGSPVYSKLSVWADSRVPAQQSVWKIIRRLFWSSLPPFKFPDNGWCWWAYQWFRKGSY